MSSKIYKNDQVNIGVPFAVNTPVTYQPPVKKVNKNVNALQEEGKKSDTADYDAISVEILINAKKEAEAIVKEAYLQAEDIRAEQSKKIEQKKKETHQNAVEEGYNDGLKQALQEYDGLIQEAKDIKQQAEIEYKKVLDSLEEDAVNTVIDIAKKVISEELNINKHNILLLVKDAFNRCAKDRKAVLKLSDADYEYVNENKDELDNMLERSEDIEIKRDLSLKPGGCIIDTPFGCIDASAQAKLDKIEQDFKSILDDKLDSNN